MIYIVDLAAVFRTDPEKEQQAFADLYQKYSPSYWAACCPGVVTRLGYKAGMFWQDLDDRYTVNEPYRFGWMDTNSFLARKAAALNLPTDHDYPYELRRSLLQRKAKYYSLRGIDTLAEVNSKLVGWTRIEDAMNSIFSFEEADFKCLKHFTELAAVGDQVIFISDANELNIHRLLYEINQKEENFAWSSAVTDEKTLAVRQNISLLSTHLYQTHIIKQQQAMQRKVSITPAVLVQSLLEDELKAVPRREIQLISPRQDLRAVAKKLGMLDYNISSTEDYYQRQRPVEAEIISPNAVAMQPLLR